jgi:hypothetical protein
MIWIEKLVRYLPVDVDSLLKQVVARFFLLFLVWLSGLFVYWYEGLFSAFVSSLSVYQVLFGTGFIIFFGSYMIQRSFHDTIVSFRPLLEMDEGQFHKFSSRLERISYSFVPCFIIALLLSVFLSDFLVHVWNLFAGFSVIELWNACFVFFSNLLVATGIWFGGFIWLSAFLISRQPLRLKLSQITVEKFRGLSMMIFWFSLFYFLSISISLTVMLIGGPSVTILEVLFSPFSLFIIVGVLMVLAPFYNIHLALLRMKRRELLEIETEYQELKSKLDEVMSQKQDLQSSENALTLIGRVFSLQIRERSVKAAPEWPFDLGFASRLISVILIPTLSRVLVEVFNRLYS